MEPPARRREMLTPAAVEHVVAALIEERNELRREGADPAVIQAISSAIADWQDELATVRRRAAARHA